MRRFLQGTVLAGLIATLVFAVVSLVATDETAAAKGKGGGSGCPRTGIACIDLWDPVICSDGHTYSNSCYAYVACATGCTPTGGGPVEVQ